MYGFQSLYFYFFLFYFCYAYIICLKITVKRNNYITATILFLPLFFLAAMRGETVGGDLRNYIPAFTEICKEQNIVRILESGYEPGYSLLNKLIGSISPTPRFLLISTSFLSLIGPCYLIYKYSNNIWLSLIMYCMMGFYTTTFNIIRQSIAVSFFFLSFPHLLNRNAKKFFLYSALSISMHYSAIALLLVFPLTKRELSLKRTVLYTIIVIGLYILFSSSLLGTIITLFFVKYNPESIMEAHSGTGWNLLILYITIFFLFFLIFLRRRKYLLPEERKMVNTLIVFLLLSTYFQLFATSYAFVSRMGLYYYVPIIITIPKILSIVRAPILKLSVISMMVFLCIFHFYKAYSYDEDAGTNAHDIIPYVFIK